MVTAGLLRSKFWPTLSLILRRLCTDCLGRRHRLAEVEALAALARVGDGGLDLQLLVRGLRVVLLAEVIQDALAFLRGGKV